MKKKIVSLCVAALMAIAQGYGSVTLTVPEVNITPGGTSNVFIYFDLGTEAYTAYQFEIAYPQGISSVADNNGNPAFIAGDVYSQEHNVSSIYAPNGLDRFQCFSINSLPFTAQSGTLLILTIKAQKTLAEGTYQATISPIEFVLTDATPVRPDAVTINITVSKNVELDENSTVMPEPTTEAVNVTVKRSINANEWSTICLPFAMSAEQVTAAFGDDVELGDFTGYTTTKEGEDVVGISVNFDNVTEISANRPYIIKVTSPINYEDGFTVNSVVINPNNNPSFNLGTERKPKKFVGTFTAQTPVPRLCLFLNDNKFWYSLGNTNMKAFRAYFDFFDLLTDIEDEYASSRIIMSFDNATGISEASLFENEKMRNGENEKRGKMYDLQGRRVQISNFFGERSGKAERKLQTSKLNKGIYIVNGKKVVK